MKYIVAVSGGVDSVALLDMVVKATVSLSSATLSRPPVSSRESWAKAPGISAGSAKRVRGSENAADENSAEFVVAHFDHGIRENSDWDARFVWELAKKYGLPFEVRREELGKDVSEATARDRRYVFLRELAKKYDAKIMTAHHTDDLIETVAINLTRGTGWRGVAVLDSPEIVRPLLSLSKDKIREYACTNGLEWIEDETNSSHKYLRNRLRARLVRFETAKKQKISDLWHDQIRLKNEIDDEVVSIINLTRNNRYFYTMIPEKVALECLRHVTKGMLTTPQLRRALLVIKTFKNGQSYQAGMGVTIKLTKQNFIVENSGEVLY